MKKKLLIPVILLTMSLAAFAQTNYNDFEGNSHHYFGFYHGQLDSLADNPDKTQMNNSEKCGKYTRSDTAFYDVLHLLLKTKIGDASPYASIAPSAPKIKMKVMTDAPVGTKVDLQLGSQNNDTWPGGVYAHFVAITTMQNQWEELTFNFWEIPTGSTTGAQDVDRVTILFNQESFNSYVYYFDDLMGPDLMYANVAEINNKKINSTVFPNPASDLMNVEFQLQKMSRVSLDLFDIKGERVANLLAGEFPEGSNRFSINLSAYPAGVYTYSLKTADGVSNSKVVIVK